MKGRCRRVEDKRENGEEEGDGGEYIGNRMVG